MLASFYQCTQPVIEKDVLLNFFTEEEIKTAVLLAGLEVLSFEPRSGYVEEGSGWQRLYVLLVKPARVLTNP